MNKPSEFDMPAFANSVLKSLSNIETVLCTAQPIAPVPEPQPQHEQWKEGDYVVDVSGSMGIIINITSEFASNTHLLRYLNGQLYWWRPSELRRPTEDDWWVMLDEKTGVKVMFQYRDDDILFWHTDNDNTATYEVIHRNVGEALAKGKCFVKPKE
jgi:hypothetical protein